MPRLIELERDKFYERGCHYLKGKSAVGYTIFSVGDAVCIRSGIFAGALGVVASPAVPADLYASSDRPRAMLLPVTVEAVVDGEPRTFRIEPELLLKSSLLPTVGGER